MRQITIYLITLLLGVFFIGCDSDDTTRSNSTEQVALVWAEHERDYYDYGPDTLINSPATFITGVILSDPLPSFDYYMAGGVTFTGDDNYTYYPGYLAFGANFNFEYYEPILTNYNPLNFEVKTSIGQLNGSISLPDTITSINLSEYDTLQLGEAFTVSWLGSNADFYSFNFEYEWIDEEYNWEKVWIDTFVVDNSITIPGSFFQYNGETDYIRIKPMNGPYPKNGAIGNMSGDGTGFLYYENESTRYEDDEIIVGSGLYGGLAKASLNRPNEAKTKERVRMQIKNKILRNK